MSKLIRAFVNSIRIGRMTQEQHLVGTDYLGNRYFEKMKAEDSRGNQKRPSRYVEPREDKDDESPELPPEWDSWLHWRRTVPPTDEEVQRNMMISQLKKQRALQKQGLTNELDATHKSTAKPPRDGSFPVFEEYEVSPGEKKDG